MNLLIYRFKRHILINIVQVWVSQTFAPGMTASHLSSVKTLTMLPWASEPQSHKNKDAALQQFTLMIWQRASGSCFEFHKWMFHRWTTALQSCCCWLKISVSCFAQSLSWPSCHNRANILYRLYKILQDTMQNITPSKGSCDAGYMFSVQSYWTVKTDLLILMRACVS